MSKRNKRLFIALLLLAALIALSTQVPAARWIEEFRLWVVSLGAIGVLLFGGVYVIVTVLLGPASGLTLMAGLAYGAWGFVLVLISATAGAAAAFLLGRYVAHARVNRWIENKPKLLALNSAVSDEGWRVVALMRLSPIIPYGMQNYLFSVTHIGFWPFIAATALGIMPATALYVYIGSLGQAIGKASTLQWVLVLAGLATTAAVAWLVGKRATLALSQQADVKPSTENDS